MTEKKTSGKVAATAGRILSDRKSSGPERSLAASALAQKNSNKLTGKKMEAKASATLKNPKASAAVKAVAGSLVSQSKKSR